MRIVCVVLCSVDNDRLELLPNINVQVRIMVRERHGALVVPRAAVREDSGQHYVFVFEGNTVQRRDISVGVASAAKYEVLSGLTTADRVAEPVEVELRNGMEIRPGEAN
jgi:multidrug efflux pump subunit AcrA (membrane-fusion protein)